MNTVIKAQRSISPPGRVLIYNKDRSIFQELDSQVLSDAIGDRHKCYLQVKIDNNGTMHLMREVKADW